MAFFGRGKNKIVNPYNLADIYPDYVEWVGSKELYTLSRTDFIRVLNDFNKGVAQALLDGETFQTPAGMGSFRIIKSKNNMPITKSGMIDWVQTNKIGKVVYFRNQHSDGYRYKLKWEKSGQGPRNLRHYYFLPCRTFKRTLAKIIKARETDYFQLS